MVDVIKPNLEFYEILNAFPTIKSFLEEQHFTISKVQEGVSMYEYFENSDHMSRREVDLLSRKLNQYLSGFLETSSQKETTDTKALDVQEELVEEEE